jgi:hypothetical protein
MKSWTAFLLSAVIAATLLSLVIGRAKAGQQTIYSNDGNVVGRYTTDTQGTTTLYGRDGRVISRGTGTIVMDGVGGTIIPDRRPHIGGQIKKDRR